MERTLVSEKIAATATDLKSASRCSSDRVQSVRELHDELLELYDPTAWTTADADSFWKASEKARFG
jgi:two-component sensor histidine kinase